MLTGYKRCKQGGMKGGAGDTFHCRATKRGQRLRDEKIRTHNFHQPDVRDEGEKQYLSLEARKDGTDR
ncbi:hypothetical protein E2C01_079175 [Portunus trituberculatus]|uniref:Uncharacterized protein n=1 Tax=Portunus trituberculatus TaxID=210409 RepID=A0A5B7ISL4_PORTR|nr:hypothetical protein [Portunus trituberculatus]